MTDNSPSPPPRPVAITPPSFRMEEASRNPHTVVLEILREYGDLVCWRSYQDVYLLNHPDLIRPILTRDHRHLSKNTFTHWIVQQVMGNGLVTSHGSEWARQRRVAQPTFGNRGVARFDTPINTRTSALVARWKRQDAGDVVWVDREMSGLAFGILGETLFGCEIGEHAGELAEILEALNVPIHDPRALAVAMNPRISTPFSRKWNDAIKRLDDLAFRIIRERGPDPSEGGVLLDRILAARRDAPAEGEDDRQMRDEVVTLILAGHETTAMAVAWSLYLLATHPDIQERVSEHIKSNLDGEAATAEDIPRLSYLKQVVQEALRLYPPVWGFMRRTERELELAGNVLPPKTTLSVVTYALHRHPEFWPDPERFDPGRFAPDQVRDRDFFAYLPFAAGPRACIGGEMAMLETQLILAQIMPQFRMRPASGDPVVAEAKLTLMPRDGIPVILSRR